MSDLQKSVNEMFLTAVGNDVDADVVNQLRALLYKEKKLKPDDLVKVFTSAPEKDVK
jgi:hypothetical protein